MSRRNRVIAGVVATPCVIAFVSGAVRIAANMIGIPLNNPDITMAVACLSAWVLMMMWGAVIGMFD